MTTVISVVILILLVFSILLRAVSCYINLCDPSHSPPPIPLSAPQVAELHRSLQEKDSETYIKRSRQMYESTPARSAVFTWIMEDVLIYALADPTMHGRHNAVTNLESIDTAA